MTKNINEYIDHTYLKSGTTYKEIDKLIEEGLKYNFGSICINSSWVKYASQKINKKIKITSTIGFPLGAMSLKAKISETKTALEDGADEIDMVMNIDRFKSGDEDYVLNEIKSIKSIMPNNILKVIIETALLDKEEIIKATKIVMNAKADFVKTSTGFSTRGATFEDIKIMKEVVKNQIQIKAAGGIKTMDDLKKMISLGANRIGTSSAVKIINNQNNTNLLNY